ncbi:permease [Pseudomonas syringae]|uniref:permease n=1 Tax=Pseudomonas syringae TaxID=317 RepID=UPI000D8BD92C|nr:permease [Pseudomonas syringae]MCH5554256.1 permease [Pseudomonas syringae pv. syringae]MCH5577906.1 permease [Pseudomonas syringae pv. syringae]MCH5669918.1 permease [Pseudomonas syringae pv. syringae]MDF5776098.1 permease [Pseudomonas syringae pv. syringae]
MTEQKTSATYTHKSETPVSDVLKTQNKNLPHNSKDLLNWTIKTIARSPKETLISELSVICLCALVLSFTLWISWDHYIENPMDSSYQVITLTGAAIYIIALGVRQKTIYNYTLKTDGATVEYYLHYPDFASSFFKGIAIFVMLVFGFVAILTGSLLFLVGPVAMAFIAAIKLLNWENPVHHRQTAPWALHEFVTVDHKRLMVIIHCDDITTGFAARFPSKALMDKYLAFLREVLPANVEYIERTTNWHQG